VTITVVTAPVERAPYGGIPWPIPGKIEAENYDIGGQGVAFNETSAGNTGNAYRTDDVDIEPTTDNGGGYNVGWIAQGEWLEYTVNVTEGTYTLDVRVASENTGTSFHIEMDGVNISGPISIPNTGGWQSFQTVSIPNITLTGGQKTMRIAMDASWFNINYVAFTTTTTTPNVPPTVSITGPASNTSFTAPASVTITANAADVDGTVSNVQFYNGTTLLGSDATVPYSFTWTNVAAGTYTITAKATDNKGATSTSSAITVVVATPPVPLGDIVGPDCGSNNTTISFTLNESKRASVTSYNWWYTGSAASTTMATGAPYSVNIQTGSNFSSGEVCVGVNLSVAPWYTQYCKSILKCNGAREGAIEDISTNELSETTIYPNPSEEQFMIIAKRSVEKLIVINELGETVYQMSDIPQGQMILLGEKFMAGMYMVIIQYSDGNREFKRVVKIK
jgi:hypothetical protein